MKKRLVAFLLVLIMVLGMLPVSAMAASNSTVVLHPSVNRTVTGVKVKVGDTISGHTVSTISGYDITVDLGKYNVNNDTFRLPYAKDIWEGVDNNKVDYISWAGGGSNKRSEGGSARLVNGKNTAYYYFKGATPTYNNPQVNCYVLYIDDSINPLGYKYNLWQKKSFTCALHGANCPDSVGSHAITVASVKAASQELLAANVLEEGYELVGWTKEAKYAPDIKSFDASGNVILSTKTNDDIFFVAKKPTPTKYTYHLIHEFNYVGGTRWDIQATTAAESYELDVNKGIPTRDGYTFLGWADKADATAVQYHGGDKITLTKDNPTKTIYAVWEAKNPQPPLIPAPSYDDLKSAIGQIQVKDVSTPSCGTENYDLIDNTESEPFNWTKTARADQPGKYDVTIKTAPYVAKYNSEKTKTHELNNANQTTLKLVISYENNKWVLDDGLRVIEVKHSEQNPPTDIPNPNPGSIAENLKVKVVCTTPNSGHEPAFYSLIDGTFIHTDIEQSGDYPTCSITISPDKYISRYSTDKNCQHTTPDDPKTVPLLWNKEAQKWAVNDDQIGLNGVVFNAVCEAVPDTFTVTYTDGVEDEVIFENDVHTGLNAGDATPAFVGGTPNREGYTFAGWDPEVAETVTANATYTAKWTPVEPEAPTADELEKLEMAVLVKCVVDNSQQHTEAYGLLGEYDEDYFVGEPRKDGDDWLCDISYYPERYVAEFNTTFQNLKHVQNDEKIVPVTLIWAGDSWQIKEQGRVPVTEVYTVTYTDGVENEEVFADQVYSDLRKDSATPAFNGTPTRAGYTFAGWEPEVAATVTQTVTYVAKWEKKTYKVVAKLYVNGKPAYYQNEDFYTYKVSGLYGENIDFDTIKAEAVEQAKQIKKASASYTAVILEDYEPNPVCTTFGEHQPGQATHYVKVNVKTEENVVIFQSFEGKTDLTKLHTTTAPYGTSVVEFLNGLGLDLDVAGYTLDTAEDGNTNWYKKDSPKWTFGANDTINGWTNVLLKYTITPHNIYAFARLNSYFAPLTTKEFDTPITLNEATLSRLGLGSYNSLGYISIGSFTFDAMPLTGDLYFGDDAELSAVAEKLATDIALETGVSDKIAEKIAWTALYKTVNEEDMAPGYPAEAGYQLSGNLDLATVMFKANGENVTGMPAVNYTYDDILEIHDFYFTGDTFTLPADPTREGYIFEGWSVKVLPAENDADHLDADGADDAADETLLKAGDTYTITAGGVVFTAQWEARTDTPYTVEHYLENLDGSYALDTTEPLKGTTDTTVTAAAKSYDNFTYDSTVPGTVASGNIAGDGSLVLKLFYTRNTYDYTVRHIKQLPDGTYDEANAEVENLSGKFEALAAVTAKDYGSHYPTNDAGTKQNIKIEKNLTIDVKYDLDNHTLTFETNGGSAIDPVTVRHGNAVARPADPTKDKYTFIGWYVDPEFSAEYDFATVLEADKTIYAKFELTSTPIGDIYVRYDVLHIKQLPDGSYDLANAEVEHLSAKKDTTVTAVVKDYRATHHINVNSTLSKLTDTAIQPYPGADGKPVYTILSVYYDLDFHTLTFDTMGGSRIDPVTVRHGNAVAKPKDPVNGGYIFDGWYTDKTYRTPYNFATVLTQDTTIYAKWFLIALPGVTIKKATPKLNTSDHFAYVQGYPDGTVKPTGNITRAETAAILFRLMDEGSRKTYYSTKSGFRDVATGSWYNTYVATLNNAGVITDSSNGYFRPNEAITRAELAAMLANFTETAGAANYFNDVSARYWAANAIAICAKLGWITGYPDGSFRPDKNVTRAELMAMINRATGRAPKSADAFLPGMKTWSDNTADKWYYLDVQEATNSHSYTVKDSEKWTALNADPNWSLYE